jgi:hypothetical protein
MLEKIELDKLKEIERIKLLSQHGVFGFLRKKHFVSILHNLSSKQKME